MTKLSANKYYSRSRDVLDTLFNPRKRNFSNARKVMKSFTPRTYKQNRAVKKAFLRKEISAETYNYFIDKPIQVASDLKYAAVKTARNLRSNNSADVLGITIGGEPIRVLRFDNYNPVRLYDAQGNFDQYWDNAELTKLLEVSRKAIKDFTPEGKEAFMSISILDFQGKKFDSWEGLGTINVKNTYKLKRYYYEEEQIQLLRAAAYEIYYHFVDVEGGCIGGQSKYNDCLISSIANRGVYMPPKWNESKFHPKKVKKFLGLERCDKIPISMMAKVEEYLGYNINVLGDAIHLSQNKHLYTFNLKLVNGHYSLNRNTFEMKNATKQIKPFTTVVYKTSKLGLVEFHDGKQLLKSAGSAKVIVVPDFTNVKRLHKTHLRELDAFKSATGLDIYKSTSLSVLALMDFVNLALYVSGDKVSQAEAFYLNSCKNGGLIFGDPFNFEETPGRIYKYDIKSAYPSIMNSSRFLIPFKQGSFIHVVGFKGTKEKPFLAYGIYRAKVATTADEPTRKMLSLNPKNFYTSIDLMQANKLGLDVEFIQDGQANALVYDGKSRVCGSVLFGHYIKKWFGHKASKVPFAKTFINVLWGKLTERKKIFKFETSKPKDLDAKYKIIKINKCAPNTQHKRRRLTLVDRDDEFKSCFARIKPFLTAKCRCKMSDYIQQAGQDNIIRTHTDSLFSKVKLPYKKKGELGDMMYEGYSDECIIENSMKYSPSPAQWIV